VEYTNYSSHARQGNAESDIIKRVPMHEKLAGEMKEGEIDCEALPYGLHLLENEKTYYSHSFAMSPRLVTNKGLIKVSGKNIDFVQVLQRN
jgi:hypothetical protein